MLLAAVPAFIPVIATLNFAFLSEVVIPCPASMVTRTEQAQDDMENLSRILDCKWMQCSLSHFALSLISTFGKGSGFLPSHFKSRAACCNYKVMDSQKAQLEAAIQTMLQSIPSG